MGFDVVAGYLLGIAGLAMVFVVAFFVRKYDIDTELAIRTMARCLRERTIERARKFCLAAPGSFFDAIHDGIAQRSCPSSSRR